MTAANKDKLLKKRHKKPVNPFDLLVRYLILSYIFLRKEKYFC